MKTRRRRRRRSRAPGSSSPALAPTTLSESSVSTAALFSAIDTDTRCLVASSVVRRDGLTDGHSAGLTARPQLLAGAAPLTLTAEC